MARKRAAGEISDEEEGQSGRKKPRKFASHQDQLKLTSFDTSKRKAGEEPGREAVNGFSSGDEDEGEVEGEGEEEREGSPAASVVAVTRDSIEDKDSSQRITKYASTSASGTNYTTTQANRIPGVPAELQSPFVSLSASWKVTVPPIAATYTMEGVLATYISPLLLTWHPQLDGILLAYNHAKLHTRPPQGADADSDEEQPMAQSVDECASPYIWLTLSALVFKPVKGLEMEGFLSLQNESHITLILWNFFTVTISHKRVPRSWKWHDFEYDSYGEPTGQGAMHRDTEQWGSWYDANGTPIEGFLRFRIRDWDCLPAGVDGDGSFLSIEGSMLTDEEEEDLERRKEAAKQKRKQAWEAAKPLQGVLKGSGKPRGRPPKDKSG